MYSRVLNKYKVVDSFLCFFLFFNTVCTRPTIVFDGYSQVRIQKQISRTVLEKVSMNDDIYVIVRFFFISLNGLT